MDNDESYEPAGPSGETGTEPAGIAEDDGLAGGLAGDPFAEEPRRGNVLLAILAGLAVAAVGVVAWGALYASVEREFIGISVLVGLLIGYVVREVSGRSTIAVRLLAVLLTAVTCVAGTVVGETAYTAKVYKLPFWDLLGRAYKDTWSLLRHRTGIQFGVYAAALVIAFLAAAPKKDPKPKDEPAGEPVEPMEPPAEPAMDPE